MSKEFSDSDLNVHRTEINHLKDNSKDFEQRLRNLETFRDKSILYDHHIYCRRIKS